MGEIIEDGIYEILSSIYTSLGFSVCLAFLFMFAYLYAKEIGLKKSIEMWIVKFKTKREFRGTFFIALYAALIAFKTLLNRSLWLNPLSDIMGGWWIYDQKGEFTAEAILNIFMLFPLIFLIDLYYGDRIFQEICLSKILVSSFKISFSTSVIIEFLQLIFRLGTVQIADIVYNTVGGIIGGFAYFIWKQR